MTEDRPADHHTRNTVLWWLLIAVASIGAMTAGFYVLDQLSRGAVDGELQVRTHGGVFTLAPDTCTSGNRGESGGDDTFFGVDLSSSRVPERIVRVEQHPELGTLITITSPAGTTPVTLASCNPLDVHLESTGARVYDVWGMSGNATVHCEELQGEVVFERCY